MRKRLPFSMTSTQPAGSRTHPVTLLQFTMAFVFSHPVRGSLNNCLDLSCLREAECATRGRRSQKVTSRHDKSNQLLKEPRTTLPMWVNTRASWSVKSLLVGSSHAGGLVATRATSLGEVSFVRVSTATNHRRERTCVFHCHRRLTAIHSFEAEQRKQISTNLTAQCAETVVNDGTGCAIVFTDRDKDNGNDSDHCLKSIALHYNVSAISRRFPDVAESRRV